MHIGKPVRQSWGKQIKEAALVNILVH